jgi:hypothetical protein
LQQTLIALAPSATCDEVRQAVESALEREKQAVREADIHMDAETKHGALTGATFP